MPAANHPYALLLLMLLLLLLLLLLRGRTRWPPTQLLWTPKL
jgi:hypothetical protein